jgi:hypothetical protein
MALAFLEMAWNTHPLMDHSKNVSKSLKAIKYCQLNNVPKEEGVFS